MKLSISALAWSNEDQAKVLELINQYGIDSIEVARRKGVNYKYLTTAGVPVCSMQSILNYNDNRLFGEDVELDLIELDLFGAIYAAKSLECRNLVFGSPASRTMPEFRRSSEYDTKLAAIVRMFRNLADIYKDITFSFEPVVARYGCEFINDFREAVKFVKKIDRRNVRVNLDLANVIETGVRVDEVIRDLKYVGHIHLSMPNLGKIEHNDDVKQILRFITNDERLSERLTVSIEAVDLTIDELEESIKVLKEYVK